MQIREVGVQLRNSNEMTDHEFVRKDLLLTEVNRFFSWSLMHI